MVGQRTLDPLAEVRILVPQPVYLRQRTMKYTVIIEQGRESGYVAYVPALKGCVSQGETRKETLKSYFRHTPHSSEEVG